MNAGNQTAVAQIRKIARSTSTCSRINVAANFGVHSSGSTLYRRSFPSSSRLDPRRNLCADAALPRPAGIPPAVRSKPRRPPSPEMRKRLRNALEWFSPVHSRRPSSPASLSKRTRRSRFYRGPDGWRVTHWSTTGSHGSSRAPARLDRRAHTPVQPWGTAGGGMEPGKGPGTGPLAGEDERDTLVTGNGNAKKKRKRKFTDLVVDSGSSSPSAQRHRRRRGTGEHTGRRPPRRRGCQRGVDGRGRRSVSRRW